MPVEHSTPANNTRYQRHQAVLTHTERAPLDHTPSVHQLSKNVDRGKPMEGEEPCRRPRSRLRESEDKEGEESVEEEVSEETGIEVGFKGAPEASESPNLALPNQTLVSQTEPTFLKIMEQMN
ncbi:hypothetical protein O181_070169 [Austropuccinia psidii MF-1]|uniref:Uncharacterized protein n=1 Tax=Austropuccinia psidii MF-1 TaxID=1389203 RepID=A0A9Q3I981_9BASI|nr:hypothetical protein [Austropuccinia psidii MF-1]